MASAKFSTLKEERDMPRDMSDAEIEREIKRGHETRDKWMVLANLQQGAKIRLKDGRESEFIRLKQKYFVGVLDGKTYNIPIGMFDEVISNAPTRNLSNEVSKLKTGELFYISKGADIVIFQFDSIKNNYIHAKNPVTGTGVKIPISMYGGNVKDINIK
jgi:hypothetical protein